MAFYRKNIGGFHQLLRVVTGIGVAVAGFVYLPGMTAWLVAAGGAGLALSGVVGYCPMCAVAGIGGRGKA